MGHIYKITNTKTNDFYVGKTSRSLHERLQGHFYASSDKRYQHTFITKAIHKYGKKVFVIESLEELDNSALNDAEQKWISLLRPRYNLTKGGEGGDTSSSPGFIRALRARDRKGSNNSMWGKKGADNPNYGRKRTAEQKDQWKNTAYAKRVSKPVTINGVRYNSIREAAIQNARSERWIRDHAER